MDTSLAEAFARCSVLALPGISNMSTSALNCNHCGATLEVGPGTKFVTCRHCGTRLLVVQTATSLCTEAQGTSPGQQKVESPDTAITTGGASIKEHGQYENAPPEFGEPHIVRLGQSRAAQHFAPILAGCRRFWRVPIFWFCLIGFFTAGATGSNSIETRRTAIVLGGPLLLLTGGWTVIWLGHLSWRRFRKVRPAQGWVLTGLTGVLLIGLLVLGFFVFMLMGFALFWKS